MQAVRYALLLSLLVGQSGALQGAAKEASLRTSHGGAPDLHSADLRGAYGVASRPTTGQLSHPPAPWLFDQVRLFLSRAMKPLLEVRRPAQDLRSLRLDENSLAAEEPVHPLPSLTNVGPESRHSLHGRPFNFARGNFLQLKAMLGFLLPWQTTAIEVRAKRSSTNDKNHTMSVDHDDHLPVAEHQASMPSSLTEWASVLMLTIQGHGGDAFLKRNSTQVVQWDPLYSFWIFAGCTYVASAMLCVFVSFWFHTKDEEGTTRDVQEELRDTSKGLVQEDEEEEAVRSDSSFMSPRTRKTLVRKGKTRMMGLSNSRLKAARETYMGKWLKQSEQEQMRTGALALTTLGVLMLCFEIIRLAARPTCAGRNWWVHGPQLAMLSLVIVKTCACMVKPRRWLYWVSISFYFAYIPAVMLPPFQMSCTDLFARCKNSDDMFIQEQQYHVNCSLQGQTSQQVLMTLFLLLPWLLPRLQMMYGLGVWLVGVYLLWTIAYMEYTDKDFYTQSQVILRMVILCVTLLIAYRKKDKLQKSQIDMWISRQLQDSAKRSLMLVFIEMLPQHVIPQVYQTGRFNDSYQCVSVMFVLIDDFDEKVVGRMDTHDLLKFLNQIFSKFDEICADHGVTKIETVGEEYVCCVGVTPEHEQESKESGGHEQLLGYLLEAASDMLLQQTDEIKFKLGIHSGPIIAGVVGQKLPRYRLFGDTMNTSARMMQKGLVGKVQFGAETKEHIPQWAEKLTTERGLVEMKGKGKVLTYLFGGKEPGGSSAPSAMANLRTASRGSGSSFGASAKKQVSLEVPKATEGGAREKSVASTGLLKKLLKPVSHINERLTMSFHSDHSAANLLDGEGSFFHGKPGDTVDDLEAIEARMLEENTKSAQDVTRTGWVPHWLRNAVLSEKTAFTPEMEEELINEHHQSFMKKMVPNIDKMFLVVVVMTVLEAMFMIWRKSYKVDHDYFSGQYRLLVFFVCRLIVLGIMLYCRHLVEHSPFSFTEPVRFQSFIVLVCCQIVLLFFVSYDVMTTGQHEKENHHDPPADQVFSLIFFLLFFLVIRWKFLFYQSIGFACLALVVLFLIDIRGLNGVYFPYLGQVLFFGLSISNCVFAHEEEQALRKRYKALRDIKSMRIKINGILETMMPPLVLKELRLQPTNASVHDYKKATIAQSDLCGFTKLASTRSASEVVGLISEIFNRFDDLTDKDGIYKVETVGDAYIAGMAEEPLTSENSPFAVVEFGKAMVKAVSEWSQEHGVSVKCRVGVHHGACVGGIVGTNQQRYHLFGKLLVGLEVLESTAPEAGVQLSKACKEAVEKDPKFAGKASNWCTERKIPILLTSKGEEHKYEEVGGRTFVIEEI